MATRSGPLKWDGDTALQFRRDVLKPFFDQYLKDGAPKADTPPVFIYNTGENHWDRFKSWPLACASGCAAKSKPLYLHSRLRLVVTTPRQRDPKSRRLRRIRLRSGEARALSAAAGPLRRPRRVDAMAADRSAVVSGSPDVLTYETPPLTEPLRMAARRSSTCRVDQRDRQRLGGQVDRRLSRRGCRAKQMVVL